MNTSPNFPVFDEQLAFLNQFILDLVESYQSGKLNSWDELDEKVKRFFTPERMEQMEIIVPGWGKMSSYSDGITLTHVMCVFLGLFMLPEFLSLTPEQQQLAKWIVLLHDVEKAHVKGKKDLTHGFRGAALAAHTLERLGFDHTPEFDEFFDTWSKFTNAAITTSHLEGDLIQDNQKLPTILEGIKQLFDENTPAALITKGVLLHMSLNVVNQYPQAAPLSETEVKSYIDPVFLPLLRVIMLADNEGWVLFYPEVRELQRNETLAAFQKAEKIIIN
jgi:hypothetical protein